MAGLAARDALYRDTVRVADRARGWFDGPGAAWRARQPAAVQALVAVESLAITTRLLAVMSWLLDPRQGEGLPAFAAPECGDMAADHPLRAVPGGAIALASRALVARAVALSGDVA
ncbi:MAG: hypothetical protein CFE37_07715 [Alphaproteobacteria bacterium PA4]|nr:MAG: hypothetical protein CFE37_07715 [Alphaproteobacteria bacterium PA4]